MGAAWMLVAAAMFALMGACAKAVAGHVTIYETAFYRSVLGLACVGAVLGGQRRLPATRRPGLHLIRASTGLGSMLLYFAALAALPLAAAVSLNMTAGLFAVLLGTLFLKERPGVTGYAGVVLGFLGVLLVLQPNFSGGTLAAAWFGLLSGLLLAVAQLTIRTMSQREEPVAVQVFYFNLIATAPAAALAHWYGWSSLNRGTFGLLLLLSVAATLGQFAMARAYARGRLATVAALAYSTVLLAALLGYAVWRETFTSGVVTGATLIALGSALTTSVRKEQR